MGKIQGFVEEVPLPWYLTFDANSNILQWVDEPTKSIVEASAEGTIMTKTYKKLIN